jgi:hypothetical protein
MKFHHLGRCVAAVAVALTAWPTMAQEAEGTSAKSTLLQSEIEVTWQDKAQGLAQLWQIGWAFPSRAQYHWTLRCPSNRQVAPRSPI